MEFECKVCQEKSKIYEEVMNIIDGLKNCKFSLSTGVWKHNTSVDLITAQRRIEYLLESNLKQDAIQEIDDGN